MRFEQHSTVVIGVSAGGLQFIQKLARALPKDFGLAILVVQHIGDSSNGLWISSINHSSKITVKEAEEKEEIQTGTMYIAPPNYHLLVESDHTLSLTVDEKVNYARPSIDVLFETASYAYNDQLIGILGTGGNHDGAEGLKTIAQMGGLTIVQSPADSAVSRMPLSALSIMDPDFVLTLDQIIQFLIKRSMQYNFNHLKNYQHVGNAI